MKLERARLTGCAEACGYSQYAHSPVTALWTFFAVRFPSLCSNRFICHASRRFGPGSILPGAGTLDDVWSPGRIDWVSVRTPTISAQ